MWRTLLCYLAVMSVVPIAGEMDFYPIGNGLRVSLGTPVFFFILLWSKTLNPTITGFLVGVSVVSFRMLLGIQTGEIMFDEMVTLHIPVFFYYLTFGTLFQFLKVKSLHKHPFTVGVLGVVIEVMASMSEIFVRSFFSHVPITVDTFFVIGGIAVIRSFFVLGFFNIFVVREARVAEEVQRKRNEQMLLHISNLHIEMIQLKKTMENAEQLTSASYTLYRELKDNQNDSFSRKVLRIAGAMHEIKKDNQRIYAGLSKLMAKERLSDFLSISEIINVILTSNRHYAKLLGKEIHFKSRITGHHPFYPTYILLSVINNLIANAVEAIIDKGEILLLAHLNGEILTIQIKDNGPGITKRNMEMVFEPGFTTKFDSIGIASNGIGLSYVKDVIEGLNGEISLDEPQDPYKTIFTFNLPINSLTEKG